MKRDRNRAGLEPGLGASWPCHLTTTPKVLSLEWFWVNEIWWHYMKTFASVGNRYHLRMFLSDSAYPKTASDIIADDFSSIYPSSPSSRMELVDDPWAPQPLALDNLYTLGPYRSSNRVKQLETLVSKLADNYSPETADGVNDGYYPSYIWPEPGKSSSSRGMTDLEKANTEHPTYVTSDPFKRAESHYKERLARLTWMTSQLNDVTEHNEIHESKWSINNHQSCSTTVEGLCRIANTVDLQYNPMLCNDIFDQEFIISSSHTNECQIHQYHLRFFQSSLSVTRVLLGKFSYLAWSNH